MSSYNRETKHPVTGEWHNAMWLDDFYGPHQYGVQFPDGYTCDPEKVKLETREWKTVGEFMEGFSAQIETDARAKIAAGNDKAHTDLLNDLKEILSEAEKGEYHDYINEKYPAPKAALVGVLEAMILKAKNGLYDN